MFNEVKLLEEVDARFLIILLAIALVVIIQIYFKTAHAFISPNEGLSKDASKRDFCSMAMNQMIQKKLSKKIITDSLYDLVTANDYKNLYLENEDLVSEVFSGDEKCKVLVKNKAGLRSFDFYLDQGMDEEFYYRIRKITENELVEKEG